MRGLRQRPALTAVAAVNAAAAPAVIQHGPPLVSASNISLTLGGRKIIDGVSLTVSPGEIVTLIGPNGAGKTTLARLLLGLAAPDEGVTRRRPGSVAGYVPQRFPIDRAIPLNVERFMTLGRRAPRAKVEAALAETGAAHLLGLSVSTLSGGEFQRVLLARALIGEPDFLVLDEPVQAVDYAGEAQLYELIGAIRARRGCGILLISHDLHMVLKTSDKVICLNRHICCEGRPQTVANDPAYIKLFGLDGMEALGIYRHRHDHAHDLSGEVCKTPHTR